MTSVADAATAEEWLARGADWSDGDHATFSVIEAATGRFAGNVSLHKIDREQANAWIGYRVAAWARGRGAATATVADVTVWAFTTLGIERARAVPRRGQPGFLPGGRQGGLRAGGHAARVMGARRRQSIRRAPPWPPRERPDALT